MTPEQRRRLLDTMQRDREDDAALADVLYLYKQRVYADTLAAMADGFGYDAPSVELSSAILDALFDEARVRAGQINATFNSELAGFVTDIVDEASYDEALDSIEQWAEARDDDRANLIGVTEAYSPHADATLAFFRANDLEPGFDFGGHGDDDPVCLVCQALLGANPHPLVRVIEVGTPHIQCRQQWHPLIDPDELPDEIALVPDEPSGIVGKDTLIHREGGQRQAAEQIESQP